MVVDARDVPDALKTRDVFYPVLGTWLGLEVGQEIAVIDGLPESTTRDQLKALGAAAASSGAVALFHVAGVTPEAPSVAAALTLGADGGNGADPDHGGPFALGGDDARRVTLTADALRSTLDRLSTADRAETVDAVAIGSPHASEEELRSLGRLVEGSRLAVPFYACTARDTLAAVEDDGTAARLRDAGVQVVVDTCVVVTPILPASDGILMTNSGKFAHYGPSNTGYEVVYGSLEDCVRSAETGSLQRDEALWRW